MTVREFGERWKSLKQFDRNLIIYWTFFSLFLIIFHNNQASWWHTVLINSVLSLLLLIVLPWLDHFRHPLIRFLRYWYILMALPFLYSQVGPFIHLITPREFDPYIIEIDRYLFGTSPNLWIQHLVSPGLNELMQISYSLYWITIPLGGAFFYFANEEFLYNQLIHYVTLTFFLSYLIFVLFPVAGPRFFLADQITANYRGFFLANGLRNFVKEVGFRGGAFPSSHVGVAMVVLIFMAKYRPKVALLVFLPIVIALSMATVYGQYHYFTDVLAGLLMGSLVGLYGISHTNLLYKREQVFLFNHKKEVQNA